MNFKEEVAMQFHPRAFSAFGADLVTNDCVAIAELVKNSYDAFANEVVVTIKNKDGDAYIEIADDGTGMTADIIKTAWAVIATPYKKMNPFAEKDGKVRRVSGNKGLGRFSASRLGRCLEIITKAENGECISCLIDWDAFENSGNISECKIIISDVSPSNIQSNTGTIIRITELHEFWDEKKLLELENALSRLVSPFDDISDFSITLYSDLYSKPVEIRPQEFINNPTYCICGNVDECGTISWNYTFSKSKKTFSHKTGNIEWDEARKGFEANSIIQNDEFTTYKAGKFSFEIRAWDLDSDSIANVSDSFNIGKREIRSSIAQYKGLSIYRDNVLVLPKSDASKDWLGLDIRRVSQIGKRISTSQIIGLLKISENDNPEIKDTTDREKLVATEEYKQFCKTAETILMTLENLRFSDKQETPDKPKEKVLTELISPLSTAPLLIQLEEAVKSGHNTEQILETVREYDAQNEKSLVELNERLTYYAQTASLGSVAVVILHEILNGMNAVKRFLNRIIDVFKDADERTLKYHEQATTAHSRLIDVANSFAPLYRKNLRKERFNTNVLSELKKSITLISNKKESEGIEFLYDETCEINTTMHPGELQTVFINLLDNACYWIKNSRNELKQIHIEFSKSSDKIMVSVSDTGTGINAGDEEKIFQPGVTRKPTGIGMGLVIVSELLNNYNCKVGTTIPGEYGGATFVFELPTIKEN